MVAICPGFPRYIQIRTVFTPIHRVVLIRPGARTHLQRGHRIFMGGHTKPSYAAASVDARDFLLGVLWGSLTFRRGCSNMQGYPLMSRVLQWNVLLQHSPHAHTQYTRDCYNEGSIIISRDIGRGKVLFFMSGRRNSPPLGGPGGCSPRKIFF